MASIAELETRLTGGASNSDVTQSTGGVVSSTQVVSQTASALTTLSSFITINEAMGNDEGDGTLTFTASTGKLTWTPKNGTTGTGVLVTSDGTYFVQGGNNGGALEVTITAVNIPSSTTSNTVTITNSSNKMFADVTKDQSDSGTTIYHCFALVNTGTDAKKDVTIWIEENTPGQDTIAIGVGAAAAGNGTSTGIETDTTDETSIPAGVTFSAPTTQDTGIDVGDLSGSGGSTHTRCWWIRQTVPAGVDTETLANTFKIRKSARV